MEYILTQEDIERFGLTDAIAGDIATPAELAMMGKYTAPFAPQEERAGALSVPMPSIEAQRATPVTQVSADLPYDPSAILPPEVPVEQQVTGTTAAMTPAAPAAAAPAMGGMDAMAAMGLLSDPVPQDPFENLSRSQRTMLGFAALKDAGMALQGKEGTAVKNVMADITERADMERKRQAAIAKQQFMQRLFGTQTGQGFDTTTPEGIDATIAALSNMAVANPSMASGLAVKIKNLQDTKSSMMAEKASTEQGEFLFPKITDALSYINPQGLMDESGNPIINPAIATRIARGGSEWVQSQEYQEFKGNLNTIKNNYTFENMVKLKKQGVTFGALSENELRQVSELVGQLDPANPQGTFKTLNDIRGFINLDRERRGLAPLDQMTSVSQVMTTDDLTPAQKKRIGIED